MVPVDICGKKPMAFLQTIQGERSQSSLLTFSMHSEATGPRDRVYALLRLANDASGGNIPLITNCRRALCIVPPSGSFVRVFVVAEAMPRSKATAISSS